MNKKRPLLLILAAACIACGVYFRPLHFDTSGELQVTITDTGVENGEPVLDTQTYTDLTAEQTTEICRILDGYTYHRTPATLFSRGSLDDMGDCLAVIYFFHEDGTNHTYSLSSSRAIAVNEKTYRMSHATDCIGAVRNSCE